MGLNIKGDTFAGRYKRVNDYPIDSTDVWSTIEDARVYARNTDTEIYLPYAGQIVTVLENGGTYKLVKDESVSESDGKKHYKLAILGSTNDNDDRYLRKDLEDSAKALIHFLAGIESKGVSTLEEITLLKNIVSKNFSKGSTGFGIYQDAEGNYHIDIDFVNIRRKLTVEEIQVQQSSYIGGKQWNTAAGIVCTRVEEQSNCWRCYFKTTDAEGRTVHNTFAINDLALCETFNLVAQAGGSLGNHYYWRLVINVGNDYIDLSKTDCDTGSDVPRVGDNIVQLGNRTDKSRQGAIVWDSVTEGGPYVRVYKGINTYFLPEPNIDLNPENSEIKAKFISEATGKDVDEEFTTISDNIRKLVKDVDKVKEQTDKLFVLWFENYIPSLSNLPASEWTDEATRVMHEQDLFFNTSKDASAGGGRAYRFEKKENGSWEWVEVTDKDTIAALELASKAQDTADGKRRVFVAQPKDSDAYDVGDMWVNATYGEYKNDMLVCKVAKKAGDIFSISHWGAASTATTAFLENLGDRILAAVTDSSEGIEAAKDLARQGIEDAYEAARKASSALNIAGENTSAIQVTKDSISALSRGIHFDSYGNITNINTNGLVTTGDFNTLLSKKVSFDSSGHITNISTSGLVTTLGFAGLFSERAEADGYVKRAEISTFITEDEAGRLISNATIEADRINFIGKTVINGKFTIDSNGDVTMNNATMRNANISGTVTAHQGKIGGFTIEDGSLNWRGYDYFGNDSRSVRVGVPKSENSGMIDISFNAATEGNFGIKVTGSAPGGVCVYASREGMEADRMYPSTSDTYTGFFDGALSSRQYFVHRKENGRMVKYSGIDANNVDWDHVRCNLRGGIIVEMWKE